MKAIQADITTLAVDAIVNAANGTLPGGGALAAPKELNGSSWAVVFDVDGTMVANLPYHQEAWLEYGRRHALPITADYYRDHIHSRVNSLIVEHLAADFGWTPPPGGAAGDEKESIYRELYQPHLREVPGVTRLVKELNARRIPCAAVSNSPRPNVDMVLSGLGLAQCFQFTLTADGMKRGKPDPYAFLAAASQLDVPIGRCIVFEDSVSGFQAAERAGAPYIAVSAGADPSALKHAGRAAGIIDDFMEITVDMLAEMACAHELRYRTPSHAEGERTMRLQ